MVEVDNALNELITEANTRGYTIPTMRVTWTHKLRKVTIRLKVTPWPDYDHRRGETRHCFNGTLDKVTDFIYTLPEL